MSPQHASLSPERWSSFSFDRQILMIGNEMNRASKLLGPADRDRLLLCYERVLALIDLTVRAQDRPARRRELLRWRDLVASLFIGDASEPLAHARAFRCLLQMTPDSAAQIPLIMATYRPGTPSQPRVR